MYCEALYSALNMSAEKTVAVSFRVSPRFKQLLEAAAEREHRSQTNMLETLLYDHCKQNSIEVPEQTKQISLSSKRGTTK